MQYRNGRAFLVGVVSHGVFKANPEKGEEVSGEDYDTYYPKVYRLREWIRQHSKL